MKAQTPSTDTYEDLKSPASVARDLRVREFVSLVARACGARFRNESGRAPREDELIGLAHFQTVVGNGSTHASFNHLFGVVRPNGEIKYEARDWPALPTDARRWTIEECETSAREAMAVLLPPELRVVPVRSEAATPDSVRVKLDVVPTLEPRALVQRVTLEIDTVIGMPRVAELSKRWPTIDPIRVRPLVSEEDCAAEALRVYRTVAPFGFGDRISGMYQYVVPSPGSISDLTDQHRVFLARGESTVIYRWGIHEAGREGSIQVVDVDARTGKAISWSNPMSTLGGGFPAPPSIDEAAVWSSGNASGHLYPSAEEIAPVWRHLLVGAKGTVICVRFDPKRDLVEVAGRTYRPDAALTAAMRAEKPPVPFGNG